MDRDKWVELLRRSVEEQGWRLFAFALMTNHFHLFVQTPEPNLSKGMQHLNGSFAGYFHARHGTCGHLSRIRARPGVVLAAARQFGVDPQAWAEGRRCNGTGRAAAAYLARGLCDASVREIAAHLGYRNGSSISTACRRVNAAMKERRLARDLDRLRQALS